MSIKRVFLVGFMGSGKSTLGRLIAKDTSWSFIDLDDYFENKHQTTIANYFELLGEEAFRKAEKETLAEVLNMEKVIVATGGGTPCFYNNMDVMNENGLTLYLKLSPKALVERLKSSKNVRPLVANKSGDELLAFIEDRNNFV